jgi:hypothetical protein
MANATDVTSITETIHALTSKLDVAIKLESDLLIERRHVSFTLHTAASDKEAHKEARTKLNNLNLEIAACVSENASIREALVVAQQQLQQAQQATKLEADAEHRKSAYAILQELVEQCGPKLDELVRHPHPEEGVQFYCQNDPPTVCKTAGLIADLMNTLRDLRFTEATFPKHWHGAAGKFDLERELMKTISAGWPTVAMQVAPRQRTVVMPGQGRRNPDFTKILSGWGAAIRKNLAQHEQKAEEAA